MELTGGISLVGNDADEPIRQSGELRLVRISLQPTIIPDMLRRDEDLHRKLTMYIECVLQEFELHIKLYNLVLNNEAITDEYITILIENFQNRFPDVAAKLHLESAKAVTNIVAKIRSHCNKTGYKKNAEAIANLVSNFSLDNKEILIHGCVLLFKSYESQLLNATVEGDNNKALMVLASEAVRRILNVCIKEKIENITLFMIKEGVLDLESKLLDRIVKLNCTAISSGDDNVDLKDKNGKTHSTPPGKIYTHTGIVQLNDSKYFKTKSSNTGRFGYRRLFEGEELPQNVQVEDNKFVDYDFKIVDDDIDLNYNEIIQNAKKNYTNAINDRVEQEIYKVKDVKDFALKIVLPLLALNEDYTIFNEPLSQPLPQELAQTLPQPLQPIPQPMPQPIIKPSYYFGIRSNVPNFVGRDKHVKKIDDLFSKEKRRVVVTGVPYVGKTEFVLKYALEKQSEYTNVIFVPSDNTREAFYSIAYDFGISTERIFDYILEDVFDMLKNHKTLLIYDNASDDVKNYLPVENYQNIFILLTSRSQIEPFETVTLPPLEKTEAYEMAYESLQRYINMDIKHSQKEKLIKELVSKLECFPITINLACAFVIEETKVGSDNPIGDYIHEYKSREKHIIFPDYLTDRYQKTVYIALLMSIKRINRFNENATLLLKICSYLNPNYISEDVVSGMIDSFNDSLTVLENYSVVSINKRLVFYEIVLDIIRDLAQSDEYNAAYEKALSFSMRYDAVIFDDVSVIKTKEGCHGQYVFKYADQNLGIVRELSERLNNLARLYFLVAYYGCASTFEMVFERIESLRSDDGFDPIGYVETDASQYEGYVTSLVSFHGHLDLLRFLIERGASVHTATRKRYLLHYAAYNGYDSVVKYLMENDANCNVRDENGSTVLHLAAWKGYDKIVNVLIDKKVDLNVVDVNEQTPLHVSAKNGHTTFVEALVIFGADVNVIDRNESTPLHLAVALGKISTVQCLLLNNAEVDKVNGVDDAPIHIAARNGFTRVVELLLDKGAKVDTIDYKGRSALHLAVKNGHVKTVLLLLNRAADANLADDKWNTPLHKAVKYNREDVVRLLLMRSISLNASNRRGFSPLHEAASWGRVGVTRLLIDSGVDVFHVDNEGRSAVQEASKNDYKTIVQMLLKRQGELTEGS